MFNKNRLPVDRAKLLTKLRELEDEWRALSADCEKRSVKYGNRTGAMATRWPKDCRASGIRKKQLMH